mgnify:CR=1 FL=1
MTQAELQLADQQLEQALATLKHLRSVAPKHTYVLRLLRRLYEQLGDYLETLDWDKTAPGPELPQEIIDKTAAKYREAERRLTGNEQDPWLPRE